MTPAQLGPPVLAAGATTLLFGLYPALKAARVDLEAAFLELTGQAA